jgi:hypothetical protein
LKMDKSSWEYYRLLLRLLQKAGNIEM